MKIANHWVGSYLIKELQGTMHRQVTISLLVFNNILFINGMFGETEEEKL